MSRTPEVPQNPEYLDPHEAAEWFPYTFYFSQGDLETQESILKAIKKYIEPKKITIDIINNAIRIAATEIKEIVSSPNHTLLSAGQHAGALKLAVKAWKDTLKYSENETEEFTFSTLLVERLLGQMIERDYWYLCEKGERPTAGPLNDKQLSHVAHYIFHMGKVTHGNSKFEFQNLPQIFQKIFSELRKYLRDLLKLTPEKRSYQQNKRLSDLNNVLDAYNLHHPNTKASLEDLLKE